MSEDNYSIFCIPRIEITKIKSDSFSFEESYHTGAIGLPLFLVHLLNKFNEDRIPLTIYLYGLGVISNEKSENFNYPKNRPDLLLCQEAVKPKVLVEVKYTPPKKDVWDNFDSFLKKTTHRRENKLILCNTHSFDEYITESKKIDCPVFVIRIYLIKTTKGLETHFIGVELSNSLIDNNTLSIIERAGMFRIDAYQMNINESCWLRDDDLFNKIKTYFDKK